MTGAVADILKTDVDQAQKAALGLFQAGDFAGSNAQLLALCQSHGFNAFRRFCIGRNHRHLGDLAAARTWLTQAAPGLPQFPLLAYEMALLELDSGALTAAAAVMRRFLVGAGQPLPGMNNIQKRAALDLCHTVFLQDRATGLGLYRLAEARGLADGLASARLMEELLDVGDVPGAATRLAQLQEPQRLGAPAQLAIGRILQRQGSATAATEAVGRWRAGFTWTAGVPVIEFAPGAGPQSDAETDAPPVRRRPLFRSLDLRAPHPPRRANPDAASPALERGDLDAALHAFAQAWLAGEHAAALAMARAVMVYTASHPLVRSPKLGAMVGALSGCRDVA